MNLQAMNSTNSETRASRRTLKVFWIAAGSALALLLTFSIAPTSFAGSGSSQSGDELGSLPSTGGGAGWNFERPDTRPALSIEADTITEAFAVILEYGPEEPTVEELSNGRVRFLFRGRTLVKVDEAALAASNVKLGLTAAVAGTDVLTQMMVGQTATVPVTVHAGETLVLPIQRMQDAGMLDTSARLQTFTQRYFYGAVSFDSSQGVLTASVSN